MLILTSSAQAFGSAATHDLFGGNILAPRAHMTGPASYDHAIEALGVTTLRYPGGSLTENMFSLRDPDATSARDPDTGRMEDFIPLSEMMQYSAGTGHAVSIVIPTRDQLSNDVLDDNGDRMPAVDREVLQDFVRDVVTGHYGEGTVAAFEIGNEYWGSGEMNAAEYGRLAAEMAQVIDRTLNDIAARHPEAAEIDVLVQVGTNFGRSEISAQYDSMAPSEAVAELNAAYGLTLGDDVIFPNGGMDWTEINNEILLSHFDDDAMAATDGVVAHVYSRAPVVDHSRWFQLEQIEEHWQAVDPTLEIHVTEWNAKANTDAFDATRDYGLFQAQEMLEQVEEFMRMDVDAAQVWPLIQNTDSALALGREFDNPTAPGEMFSMMSENLPGMRMLDFDAGDDRDTELHTREMDVHAFADGRDMLFYFTSNLRNGVVDAEVDISNLVDRFGEMEITTLNVVRGAQPGNTGSPAMVEHPDPEDLHAAGLIETVLAPGEIMQVRLSDVTPTADFAETFAATGQAVPEMEGMVAGVSDSGGSDAGFSPDAAPPARAARGPGDEEADGSGDEDGGDLGGMWMLGLLPLLALLG
ncbi:hypothetical protein [Sagittula salina]|uniref:Alpha-L-arabinofuranosidase n=1 Tax=Sagittula salina TaxID=2820268 RepID=A0A940MPX3_9RHOB|nr:hypothetical protein [Sagittula salina]MBP0482581.1 hypothetical protein [Sagittula salina]